jgi:hypothetical protein
MLSGLEELQTKKKFFLVANHHENVVAKAAEESLR